jgi:hypothetical protein
MPKGKEPNTKNQIAINKPRTKIATNELGIWFLELGIWFLQDV